MRHRRSRRGPRVFGLATPRFIRILFTSILPGIALRYICATWAYGRIAMRSRTARIASPLIVCTSLVTAREFTRDDYKSPAARAAMRAATARADTEAPHYQIVAAMVGLRCPATAA